MRPLALLFVCLQLIGQMDFFFEVLNQPLFTIAEDTPEQINISLPLLIFGPFAALIIYITSQGRRTILIDDILPTIGLAKSQAYAIGTVASYVVIVMAFPEFAWRTADISVSYVGRALTVGIGFRLQNTVNNFVSGFLIIFDPLLKVGEKVGFKAKKVLSVISVCVTRCSKGKKEP